MALKAPLLCLLWAGSCGSHMTSWLPLECFISNQSNKGLATRTDHNLGCGRRNPFKKTLPIFLCPQLRQKPQTDYYLQSALFTFPNALYKQLFFYLRYEQSKIRHNCFLGLVTGDHSRHHLSLQQTYRIKAVPGYAPFLHMSIYQGKWCSPLPWVRLILLMEGFLLQQGSLVLSPKVEDPSLLCFWSMQAGRGEN